MGAAGMVGIPAFAPDVIDANGVRGALDELGLAITTK
jgi:hypothetical protein